MRFFLLPVLPFKIEPQNVWETVGTQQVMPNKRPSSKMNPLNPVRIQTRVIRRQAQRFLSLSLGPFPYFGRSDLPLVLAQTPAFLQT